LAKIKNIKRQNHLWAWSVLQSLK